jgi:hypothetical protein
MGKALSCRRRRWAVSPQPIISTAVTDDQEGANNVPCPCCRQTMMLQGILRDTDLPGAEMCLAPRYRTLGQGMQLTGNTWDTSVSQNDTRPVL